MTSPPDLDPIAQAVAPAAPVAHTQALSWQRVTTEPNLLGESPFWQAQEGRLYWVDIAAKQVLRLHVASGDLQRWTLQAPFDLEPGCIAPAAGGGLVLALRDGIYRARQWGGPLQRLHRFSHDCASMRANDGKCDPRGRFWVGMVDESKQHGNAELMSLECQASVPPIARTHADGAFTGNGLAWSNDEQTVYWSDTARHVIHAFDWDAQHNTLSRQRVFQQFAAKPADWQPGMGAYRGRPDGAAVDVLGNYWVAMYEGARVLQFSPSGELLAELATPVQCPTMPCFGGDDLKTLYLTSARKGRGADELQAYPWSGCVLATRVQVPGLPVNFFHD